MVDFIVDDINRLVILAIAACAVYYIVNHLLNSVRGVAILSPMIEIDGVILKSVSPETTSHRSTYDTGSFTTYQSGSTSTSYKNTSSYTSYQHYIKFVFQNNNDYPVDILLKFKPYEQIIRHNDGTYKETYKDAPQCDLLNLPAKEKGKILLSLNDQRMKRRIHLESISVKIAKTAVWEERKIDLLIKK